ncbi:hypothetical protein [Gimesia algae]|uniref:Uncharacterized protein n=1 Tax=Gimesia algae TaxID=2527971 RepID=A0A517VM65_9PLAN|nr:hypothetical protein [Gimesia algae]QDT94104.1 hypothetical protein Pan161_57970 [Gimesia algae]
MTHLLFVVTKTFTKRAWLAAVLAVSVLVFVPLVFRGLMSIKELGAYGISTDPFQYHFAFLGLSWIFFIAICVHALQGCEKIVLRLPVSSTAIVSGLILLTVGLVLILNLVTNGLYRVFFFDQNWLSEYWPLLGPLLFLVTLVLVGHSLFWSRFAPSITGSFFSISFVAALCWWFASRYFPNGFQEPVVPWNHVTLLDWSTLLVINIAAWYQGTRAFEKVRAGTAEPSLQWSKLMVCWNTLSSGIHIDRPVEFSSQQRSLSQLQWRDSCRRTVMIGGLYFGAGGVFLSFLLFKLSYVPGGQTAAFWSYIQSISVVTNTLILLAALLMGFLLGDGIHKPGRIELKRYLSAVPLSDRDFSAILMRNLVKTVCLVWTSLVLGCLLSHIVVLHYFDFNAAPLNMLFLESYVSRMPEQSVSFLFLSATILWGVSSTMVSIFWTGRTWFYLTVLSLFGGLCFALILIGACIQSESITGLLYGLAMMLSTFILAGTVVAYLIAYRKKLITLTGVLMAVLFLLTAVWFCSSLRGDEYDSVFYRIWNSNFFFRAAGINSMRFFVFVLLTLLVTPCATIPLAVSWNRHR